jgi:hypothetical protein
MKKHGLHPARFQKDSPDARLSFWSIQAHNSTLTKRWHPLRMTHEFALKSEGYQPHAISVRSPGPRTGREKGISDEEGANKNPISQEERWGLFFLPAF